MSAFLFRRADFGDFYLMVFQHLEQPGGRKFVSEQRCGLLDIADFDRCRGMIYGMVSGQQNMT